MLLNNQGYHIYHIHPNRHKSHKENFTPQRRKKYQKRSNTIKRYDKDVSGYVYVIRTKRSANEYYVGSTSNPKNRFYLHRSSGALVQKESELSGFIQFTTMKEAYTFEYALHHYIEANGYEGLSTIIERFGRRRT